MCIARFSQKYLSNTTNMLNTEVIIITCKKKRKYNGPTSDSQCLFRALKILSLSLMKDWWQAYLGPPSQDLTEIKGSPFEHLPKAYQKPSAEPRSWQGHQKDFVQTQGQAQYRTRARTSQGQKRYCERQLPRKSSILPKSFLQESAGEVI